MSDPTVERRIVVIGGTGAVGREVAALVADDRTEVVVVARDVERAAAVARSVAAAGVAAVARRADVADPADRGAALAGATVVVTCVERANAEIAGQALAQGAHVVDISASPEVLAAIELLDGVASSHGTTAVLGVGLAPGLTNLLARACVDRLPDPTKLAGIDISVLVGLGEHHGPDAIRWTLDGLAAPTPRSAPTSATSTAPSARPRKVMLPGFGRRTAHPFPFADQHTLSRTLGAPVTTRLCFDSRAVTALAFALRRTGLLRHLPREALADGLAHSLGRVHVGSDRYAVAVIAAAADGKSITATATGRRQAHATAVVTADVVRRLLDGESAPGVHLIDQAVAVDDALTAAEDADITVTIET